MGNLYTEWQLQLIDGRTMLPIDDDSGVYNVLEANDPSEVTIYENEFAQSAASNPGTLSNGRMRFFTANDTTSVDICVQTSNGHFFFLEDITPSHHKIVVWPDKMEYTMIIPYQVVGGDTQVDSGFDILDNMLIRDCFIHVTTLGTGAVLDIGTSTDPDGFADAVVASATGFPVTLLDAALVSGSSLIGALLSEITGSARKLHKRANATSGANIVYINATSSSTAGEGYIYLHYHRVPT